MSELEHGTVPSFLGLPLSLLFFLTHIILYDHVRRCPLYIPVSSVPPVLAPSLNSSFQHIQEHLLARTPGQGGEGWPLLVSSSPRKYTFLCEERRWICPNKWLHSPLVAIQPHSALMSVANIPPSHECVSWSPNLWYWIVLYIHGIGPAVVVLTPREGASPLFPFRKLPHLPGQEVSVS